jgi:NADP-dependent 3-hydroxy acid dehydrogenase YdfG
MLKTALITGATSGIGRATTKLLLAKGYQIIACGRRQDRLEELREEFGEKIYTLAFDVRDRDAVFSAISSIPSPFNRVDVLINNAGNAHGLDPIQSGNPDDWDAMLDINVKGLLYMTKAVLPILLKSESPHILNIGSTAGKEVYPGGNVYCASKHAVDALNTGIRMDLNGTGVRVGTIHPGLVETEFSMVRFKGDAERASKVYKGYIPLTPEDVAESVWFAINQPKHVNITEIVLMPTAQASNTIVHRT